MILGYADHFGLAVSCEQFEAPRMGHDRANRSGRTGWQLIQDLAVWMEKATL